MYEKLNQTTVELLLSEALKTGGDFAEIFYEDTEGITLTMNDMKIDSANYKRNRGVGIRVIYGNSQAYGFTADISTDSLIKTAKTVASVVKGKLQLPSVHIRENHDYSVSSEISLLKTANKQKADLLKRGSASAMAFSNEIKQVSSRYIDVVRRISVFNSDGLSVSDIQPRTRVSFNAIASDGERKQGGFTFPGRGMGFEAYKLIDVEKAGEEAARTACTMLHGKECPAKAVPVVIGDAFGGVILHEACVHGLEATFIAKNNSVFCGKLGQKIASDIVTAVDDATLPGQWGTRSIDDEGTPSARNVLIENGILKSYLVDRFHGKLMNTASTGSGRRESYKYAPTSRMSNTFFANGKDDDDEMISSIPDGLFAAKMGGGSVNPMTGDFNFTVEEGYWIKNGQIHCPVRGATLIGKGVDILMKIDRIGKKMTLGEGMCGSLSGMIPTTVGQPRIRVSEILVGGSGKEDFS